MAVVFTKHPVRVNDLLKNKLLGAFRRSNLPLCTLFFVVFVKKEKVYLYDYASHVFAVSLDYVGVSYIHMVSF